MDEPHNPSAYVYSRAFFCLREAIHLPGPDPAPATLDERPFHVRPHPSSRLNPQRDFGQAGYDTGTSLITPFYTFAPENIAELLGQRRRWQVSNQIKTTFFPVRPSSSECAACLDKSLGELKVERNTPLHLDQPRQTR